MNADHRADLEAARQLVEGESFAESIRRRAAINGDAT